MPGLVNIHCHPTSQPITRGIREELGNPNFYSSALYDRTNLWAVDDDGLTCGAQVALGELLRSGVTTVIDYVQRIPPGWLDLLAGSGMRVYAAPGFRDAQWVVHGGSKLDYDWDETEGRRQMEEALALIDEANAHDSGRLKGVLAPAQIDTCTEKTLTQRHGRTPVQWLNDIGVLGPMSTIGHCIFIDEHPWTHWATTDDLTILASSGTTVAHCPVVFSRYGQSMHSLGKYLRAGVHVGMGCDTAPHNMLEEMRAALILSRAAAGNMHDIQTTDVFNAVTIGGARAFGRDDIGRLAPGARSDLVLLDLNHPQMRPMRDPLRNLIYTAADRAVRDVYVDGVKVLDDGEVLSMDMPKAMAGLDAAQQRAEAGVPDRDPEGRSGLEVSPLVLPLSQ
jgi:cytosine/adenosine deaminase-related metal-dependent hydrolase